MKGSCRAKASAALHEGWESSFSSTVQASSRPIYRWRSAPFGCQRRYVWRRTKNNVEQTLSRAEQNQATSADYCASYVTEREWPCAQCPLTRANFNRIYQPPDRSDRSGMLKLRSARTQSDALPGPRCAQRHSKFLASSVSPCSLYCACLGYGHSGRLRPGNALPVAITDAGTLPFSTQLTIALNMSN
jgi:hypothetical protein